MNSSLKTLSKYLNNDFNPASIFITSDSLSVLLNNIEEKYDNPKPPSIVDLSIIHKILIKSFFTKDRNVIPPCKIKYLPYVIYFKEESISFYIAEHYELCSYVLDIIDYKNKTYIVLPLLIKVYLCNYDSRLTSSEIIRLYIQSKIYNYQGKSPRIIFWKKSRIYEDNAALPIAESISRAPSIRDGIDALGYPNDVIAGNFFQLIIKKFYESNTILPQSKYDALKPFFEFGDTDPRKETVAVSATNLIPLCKGSQLKVHEVLRDFYLKHLGDPRMRGHDIHWSNVSEDAKTTFKSWITKLDLELFFEIVRKTAKDIAWGYRQKFWEAYLPYIENTWVALGNDARRLILDFNKNERISTYAELTGVVSDQSIFIFEIKDYIFIEWSHCGALRWWKKHDFPIIMEGKSYSGDIIKKYNCDLIQNHSSPSTYFWQKIVEDWLLIKCGVRPSKSYFLD